MRKEPILMKVEFIYLGKEILNSMTNVNRKGINMKRKWLLLFASLFLSITMVVGCNNDDQTPPPPNVHNQEDNQEDTSQEEPSVKEPQEKAEDLSEDADEVTESEKRRDKKMEENFEESVENLE